MNGLVYKFNCVVFISKQMRRIRNAEQTAYARQLALCYRKEPRLSRSRGLGPGARQSQGRYTTMSRVTLTINRKCNSCRTLGDRTSALSVVYDSEHYACTSTSSMN